MLTAAQVSRRIPVSVNRSLVNKSGKHTAFKLEHLSSAEIVDTVTSGYALAMGVFNGDRVSNDRAQEFHLIAHETDAHISIAQVREHPIGKRAVLVHRTAGGGLHMWFVLSETIHDLATFNRYRKALTAALHDLQVDGSFNQMFLYGHTTDDYSADVNAVLSLDTLTPYLPDEQPVYEHPAEQIDNYTIGAGYGERVLSGECETIRQSKDGTRHNTAIQAGLRVYSIVRAGLLDEHRATQALTSAMEFVGLGSTGSKRAKRPKEISGILSWCKRKALPRIVSARTRTARRMAAQGVSNAAREKSIHARDNITLYMDRLITAGYTAGDDIASWREVQRRVKDACGVGIGRMSYKRLLQCDLFAGGVMPTCADVNAFYGITGALCGVSANLAGEHLQTSKTYGAALATLYHGSVGRERGESTASYDTVAETLGVSKRTAQRYVYAARDNDLLKIRHRHNRFHNVPREALPEHTTGHWFLIAPNGATYQATQAGYDFAVNVAGAQRLDLVQQQTNAYTLTVNAVQKFSVTHLSPVLSSIRGVGCTVPKTSPNTVSVTQLSQQNPTESPLHGGLLAETPTHYRTNAAPENASHSDDSGFVWNGVRYRSKSARNAARRVHDNRQKRNRKHTESLISGSADTAPKKPQNTKHTLVKDAFVLSLADELNAIVKPQEKRS